tara:strand:- start:1372 stop:1983 length:612 start_codon:yes stop_codon:yes gene_type:complete
MYVIFFHISGLALIEILFYFFYIGNMETQMFINNINHLLHEEEKTIDYNMYNVTFPEYNTTFIKYYEIRAQNGEDERKKRNFQLFADAIVGFIVILSITCVVTFFEIFFKKKNVRRVSSMDSVRNICIEMAEYSQTNTNIPTTSNLEETSEQTNKINIFIFHTILYSGLLVSFEYWLFNNIIMKYKVISNEEIEYLFAKQLDN